RSVPERRSPSLVASSRMLASTGRVVLVGTAALTAFTPSDSCSRVMVNFIETPECLKAVLLQVNKMIVVAVERAEMCTSDPTLGDASRYDVFPTCIPSGQWG